MAQYWSVSHEMFNSNADHGLPVAQVRDGDILCKAGDNEVQLVKDADGATAGHPVTWAGLHNSPGSGWAAGVVHLNLPLTAHWHARLTPFDFGITVFNTNVTQYVFKGHIAVAQFEDYVSHGSKNTHPVYAARMDPADAHGGFGVEWQAGPATVGLYWLSLGGPQLTPGNANLMRVHLDRLDGRMVTKPEFYERHGKAWNRLPDTWPGGAMWGQGAKADGHAHVWNGTTWAPMGTNAYIWTGSRWVSP